MIMADEPVFLAIGECMIEFAQADDGSWQKNFAGDTFNTAWHFANSPNKENWNTSYFTRVGTDTISGQLIDFTDQNGISTQWIKRDIKRQLGLYIIETIEGERSFTYWRENSAARCLADDIGLFTQALEAASCIYFSGITLAILASERRQAVLGALAAARSQGKAIAFDPNMRPRLWESVSVMCDTIMAAANVATIIMPGLDEQSDHFGDTTSDDVMKRYLNAGANEVVVKNGGGPVLAATRQERCHVDDITIVTPIDTTGAGDSFNGAYLAMRLNGHSLEGAVRFAHETASGVVQHRGALKPR